MIPSERFDLVVAGGGPAGLAAAEAAARAGLRVALFEQGEAIGSPVRTSGASFIEDMRLLEIPEALYHPIGRGRFVAPNEQAEFRYEQPVYCVLDVRGLYQFLAERAAAAGARIFVSATVTSVLTEQDVVQGITVRLRTAGGERAAGCPLVIDASGYRAQLGRAVGIDQGFTRFGVGAEYDLYAPSFDQDEALLIVGSQIAPAGYAWAFPWGRGRVRVGVGIIHPDSRAQPQQFLERLIAESGRFGMDLTDAQPIEYHRGMIPSGGMGTRLVGPGMMLAGDAAGQASTLVGEGIRWAIYAGRLAGQVAAEASAAGDYSARFLSKYEREWRAQFGARLRIAHRINRRITRWSDADWDRGARMLRALTPAEFATAMRTDITMGWMLKTVLLKPGLARTGAGMVARRLLRRRGEADTMPDAVS